MSESVFKIPTVPTRHRRQNGNNTRSTYIHYVEMSTPRTEIVHNNIKKIEEQFEVIKKICQPVSIF